jgi:hypothetical protein
MAKNKATESQQSGNIPEQAISILEKLVKSEPAMKPVLELIRFYSSLEYEAYESLSLSLMYQSQRLKFLSESDPREEIIDDSIREASASMEAGHDDDDDAPKKKGPKKDPIEMAFKEEKGRVDLIKTMSQSIPALVESLAQIRAQYISPQQVERVSKVKLSRTEKWAHGKQTNQG